MPISISKKPSTIQQVTRFAKQNIKSNPKPILAWKWYYEWGLASKSEYLAKRKEINGRNYK